MSERLTLVVFKDHLSSRTLTVRLAWLRAFGFTLLSVIGLAVIAAALFLNAYRKTIASGSVANAARVEELEKEAAEAKTAYESLRSQALGRAVGGPALAGAAYSFSLLPAEAVLEKLAPPESLPFRLETLRAQWKGQTLQIRSAIEYAKDDGGNQQGHFIIILRGPQTLTAYPDGVFDAAGAANLLKPDAGEFFSVSRYREVKADFGPFAKREEIQSVEIFIFDGKKRLIFVNRIGMDLTAKTPVSPKRPESGATHEKTATPTKKAPPAAPTPPADEAAPPVESDAPPAASGEGT